MNPSEPAPSYSSMNGSNAEDSALIERMVDADETALGALYDRWVRPLYSLVLHLLRDPDEAEDVVEETFWQAWRKADSYQPSKGAVSTWLLTIGRRKALDRLRARKRSHEDSMDESGFADLASSLPDPESQAEGAELLVPAVGSPGSSGETRFGPRWRLMPTVTFKPQEQLLNS